MPQSKEDIEMQIDQFSDFVSNAVDEGDLIGTSSPPPVARNRLNAFKYMIAKAQVLFVSRRIEDSYSQLLAVLQKCNGEHIDFVQGDARIDVFLQITNLIAVLVAEIERDHAYGGLKALGYIS